MDETQKILNPNIQAASPKLMVAQGIIQNLPEIVDAIKEIYYINRKEALSRQVMQSRLDELNINKENFNVLVVSLTELSKMENADKETMDMYRGMIKTLFDVFTENMRSSRDVSDYLNRF